LLDPKALGPINSAVSSKGGGPRIGGGETRQSKTSMNVSKSSRAMYNPRLAKRSEVFTDDNGNLVEKRCFVCLVGEDDHTQNAIALSLSFNIFDEPRVTPKLNISFRLQNIFIELCEEVIQSLTLLIPEFKPIFRYNDLYPARYDLNRYIQLRTPLYLLK
jgi:hypothetical protein